MFLQLPARGGAFHEIVDRGDTTIGGRAAASNVAKVRRLYPC